MNNWWKSPVLQGPENDYGDYDYLIEEVPSNNTKWNLGYKKCDYCGNEHKLNSVFTGYFRTIDGWDSTEECECWKCYLKRKITTPFKTLKRKIKKCIRAIKEIDRINKDYKEILGRPLPKERKKNLYKILIKEV